MSVLSATFDYLRLQDDEVAWKLLRAKNAPFIIAILDMHLGGSVRKLTVAELESLVAVDLDELRLGATVERKPHANLAHKETE